MEKRRLEAFSDGVLAVAITLLVLDLHLDASSHHERISEQLRHDWPSYAAYLVSFLYIGVIWVNHHALFSLARRVDRAVVFYNLFLLLWVTTIPFSTGTLAEFLRGDPSDSRWAVALYGTSMTGMAIGFTLILNRLIREDLLHRPVPKSVGNRAVIRFGLGALLYPLFAAVGLLWPPAVLIAYAGIAVYYMFDQTPILPPVAES